MFPITVSGNLENLPKHREYLDSKDQRYCTIFSKDPDVSTKSVLYMTHSQITEIVSGKISGRTGKKHGKHREFENRI